MSAGSPLSLFVTSLKVKWDETQQDVTSAANENDAVIADDQPVKTARVTSVMTMSAAIKTDLQTSPVGL
jgi:hypothetical protein